TALVFDLKEKFGIKKIERIENRNKKIFFDYFKENDKIEIIGNKDPTKRIPIISFNIKHIDKYFHPRFVTKLLSDLFGIQSRAGCSCAGPYGHRLLGITNDLSQKYRNMIINEGISGVKPGWVRVNLHYVFDENDIKFIIDAIEFIARHGDKFLLLYTFNPHSAEWKHKDFMQKNITIGLDSDYDIECIKYNEVEKLRTEYFTIAEKNANMLKTPSKKDFIKYDRRIEELKYFYHCLEIKAETK
ncbi:MAG: aminotransferase class V-fold PLP-dependent enzyme, partial [Candidatus Delongbacteria bacterium]|nr:aminotransferase class V-fold PLP-dependent enzyme [Candidatus Delongbacteria bacterium]